MIDLEPLHENPDLSRHDRQRGNRKGLHADLEEAVSRQELLAGKEEIADLRAKVYLLEKEKSSLELSMEDRHSIESILKSHIEHLQEEVDRLNKGEHRLTSLSREDKLRQRVDSLLDTLNRVTRNSEIRHKQSDDLVGDLKRANRYVKLYQVVS